MGFLTQINMEGRDANCQLNVEGGVSICPINMEGVVSKSVKHGR